MVDPDDGELPSRRTIWIVLLFGCLTGLSVYVVTPLESPNQLMLASDVYQYATQSWLEGDGLYGVYPPDRPGYAFLYPPIVVLVFLPHALLSTGVAAFVLQTLLNIITAIATAFVIYRALERRDISVDHLDLAVLCAFMLLSSYSAIQFINGQVNLWLALAIAIGFDAMDRNRSTTAGVAFAIAALFKVFPAILGLWLLRNRSFRAVGAAIATGLGGLFIGVLLFGPELTITYLGDVLVGRFEGSTYDGTPDPNQNVDGIHRQLAAIWPEAGASHTVVALAIMAPLVAIALYNVDSRFHRDVAGLGILVSILLFLPLQPLYFPLIVFPLCMLLYTLPRGMERYLLLVGTLFTFVNLDPKSIEIGFRVIPAPEAIANGVLRLSEVAFTFVLPPTLGLWILLATCIIIQFPDIHGEGPRSVAVPA